MQYMKGSQIAIILLILVIFVGGGYFVVRHANNAQPASIPQVIPTNTPFPSPTASAPSITSASNSPTPQAMKESSTTVIVTASGFQPQTITISAGQTIMWINKSGDDVSIDSDPHPVHTSYPPLNIGVVANGATASLTFSKIGTYHYHNHLNPSETGTIIVQ
jgi:plastocyanin